MAAKEDAGLDLFVKMSAMWRNRVPPTLVHESPGTLTRILELGLVSPGVSHSAMRPKLGLNQPEMSKITERLVQARWVEVTRSKKDRRLKLITATAAGRKFLSSLKADLNALLSAEEVRQASSQQPKPSRPASRKKVKVQAREKPFWDFDLDSLPDEEADNKPT